MHKRINSFGGAIRSTFVVVICSMWSLLSLAVQAETANAEMQRRVFTAADAVSMKELIKGHAGVDQRQDSLEFVVSPNGERTVLVTRQANLVTGNNDFQIILWDMADLVTHVNSDNSRSGIVPEGDVLATLSNDSNHHAVEQLRWLDDYNLAFIGETTEQPVAQVFRLEVDSKKLTRLTNHPERIFSFDASPAGDLVFNASTFVPEPEKSDSFYVDDRNFFTKMELQYQTLLKSEERLGRETYYLGHRSGSPASQVGKPFLAGLYMMQDLWLSPNGDWAIGARVVPSLPRDWISQYLPYVNNKVSQQAWAGMDADSEREHYFIWYLELFNLKEGTSAPLFDAPIGLYEGGYEFELRWLADGESVLIGNTFLPLDVSDPEELARRRQSPAAVEYSIKTKQFRRVAEYVVPPGETSAPEKFSGLVLSADDTVILKYGDPPSDHVFRRENGSWRPISDRKTLEQVDARRLDKRLELVVHQDLNTPPNVVARDRVTGLEKPVTDLNPQFAELRFGRAEVFNWSDSAGTAWEAGLVYPPDYDPETRYPLVIQTHGFSKDKFLIEGPFRGAYAAQALANRDIVVLQVQDQRLLEVESGEREMYRLGVESAIDKLDERKIIDRSRVGIMGFSRTGHHVHHILTFSDYDFAAATIADAFHLNFMTYLVTFGTSAMSGVDDMLDGAVPWGARLADWVSQNPSMHQDRVKTPLRLEQYTLLMNWWDIYVLLRRQGKPAEWLVLHNSAHELERASQRLMVQQGNVDWFTFWLKGEEDASPAKADQYERWRKFRAQQEGSVIAANEARLGAKKRETDRARYEKWLRNEMAANDVSTAEPALETRR